MRTRPSPYFKRFLFLVWSTFSLHAQEGDVAGLGFLHSLDSNLDQSLVAYIKAQFQSIDGIEASNAAIRHASGSEDIILAITLATGDVRSQWIAELKPDRLTEVEKQLPAEDLTVYAATGNILHYTRSRTAILVNFVGPFGDQTLPIDTQTRVLVSPENMSFGLDGFCRAAVRMKPVAQAEGVKKGIFATSNHPLPESTVAEGRSLALKANLSPEEEHQLCGPNFPLSEFISVAMKVPSFKKVLDQVLNEPSATSILMHGGLDSYFSLSWNTVSKIENLPGISTACYQFPVKLLFNGQEGAKATVVVTSPKSPLQLCAGILLIYAENPSDKSKRLLIQLLASQSESANPR